MTIAEFVYDFKTKGDKLDSQFYTNLTLPQIIRCLNEAQITIVKTRYGILNSTKKGFESNQVRRDELQCLLVPEENISLTKVNDFTYSLDLLSTKKDYFHLARVQALGSKGCCGTKVLNGFDCRTDNFNLALIDKSQSPNFEWRKFSYRIAENKLRLYTDSSFTLETGIIDYLRYPIKMDMAGYIHFNGNPSSNINCELPEFIQYDIIDEAVKNCKLYLNDVDGAQGLQTKISKTE